MVAPHRLLGHVALMSNVDVGMESPPYGQERLQGRECMAQVPAVHAPAGNASAAPEHVSAAELPACPVHARDVLILQILDAALTLL